MPEIHERNPIFKRDRADKKEQFIVIQWWSFSGFTSSIFFFAASRLSLDYSINIVKNNNNSTGGGSVCMRKTVDEDFKFAEI